MIIAIDVHYRTEIAKAVSIEFDNWKASEPNQTHIVEIPETAAYVPGQFYKRELPGILEVLKLSDLTKVDLIIVDGYVFLDDLGKRGLGAYLFDALDGKIPIVGVAKRSFHSIDKLVIPIKRGESKNPLFITSQGADLAEMAGNVKNMDGAYRIPTLLKILDVETKL
ncbi:MAG: endonuclease V [Saprospiraceae bacterium]